MKLVDFKPMNDLHVGLPRSKGEVRVSYIGVSESGYPAKKVRNETNQFLSCKNWNWNLYE